MPIKRKKTIKRTIKRKLGGSAAGLATQQINVATDTTLIVAARPGREAVTIVNHGTTDVYLGNSLVDTDTGVLLSGVKGASVTLPTGAAVYGIADGAAQLVSVADAY